MAMHVGQALLHCAKYCDLHFLRHTSEVVRNIEGRLDFAALRETVDIPSQRGRKTHFVEQRRMKIAGDYKPCYEIVA